MGSESTTVLKPEWLEDSGNGTRLFAYSCALSGKEGKAKSSNEGKVKDNSGINGLMKELEKTKLDACDKA